MSSEYQTQRNRLIAGLAILAVLLILVIYAVIVSIPDRDEPVPARIGHRSPLPQLAYCGTEQDRLCIVSFTQEVDGEMQVNFQAPYPYFPQFILTIGRNGEGATTYECTRVKDAPTSIYCTGAAQVPGQILQFTVLYKNLGTVLAEGKFAIIGIALMTPEMIPTATSEGATATPMTTETLAPLPSFTTPTASAATPPASPSYPNPSYP